ncbi:UNVERIFIED_CONTAM: hypothetical protein FKN15_009518 [Acipenser sinensis]
MTGPLLLQQKQQQQQQQHMGRYLSMWWIYQEKQEVLCETTTALFDHIKKAMGFCASLHETSLVLDVLGPEVKVSFVDFLNLVKKKKKKKKKKKFCYQIGSA